MTRSSKEEQIRDQGVTDEVEKDDNSLTVDGHCSPFTSSSLSLSFVPYPLQVSRLCTTRRHEWRPLLLHSGPFRVEPVMGPTSPPTHTGTTPYQSFPTLLRPDSIFHGLRPRGPVAVGPDRTSSLPSNPSKDHLLWCSFSFSFFHSSPVPS